VTPNDSANTTSSIDLLEFARLIEVDEISSDILPAYVQALLSVRLIEPDALCRRAALRLACHYPPLTAHAVAERIRNAAREIQDRSATSPHEPQALAAASPVHFSLTCLLERLRRLWPTQSP